MPHLNYTQSDVETLRRGVCEFGFGFLPDLVPPDTFAKLEREAKDTSDTAVSAKRTGAVNYQASIVSLGPESQSFLFGLEMTGLLSTVFGEMVAPSEDRCCLTLYREGDHLGPHRDEPANECWVTAILYIDVGRAAADAGSTGLVLRVYGEEVNEEPQARLTIPTAPGILVLGRGAKFWHERPALAHGEYVAALTACYRRSG
jgi:hypothetical protein